MRRFDGGFRVLCRGDKGMEMGGVMDVGMYSIVRDVLGGEGLRLKELEGEVSYKNRGGRLEGGWKDWEENLEIGKNFIGVEGGRGGGCYIGEGR
jgi:hypothetical protein